MRCPRGKGMEITWLTYSTIGQDRDTWFSDMASVRYRLLIPAQELRKLGHRVHLLQLAPDWSAEEVESRVQGEVVVISKPIAPDPGYFSRYLEQTRRLVQDAQASGRKVVADICDDH